MLNNPEQPDVTADKPILPLPPLKEWAVMALVLAALLGLHVADLHKRGMRLSTTSFIDPAGVLQVTAWDVYSARRLRSGEFPLWNPYTGIGQPHLANLQTAVFYPLKLPFYLTGTMTGHDVYLFLRLLLLALGPFILLRAMGVGRWGSAFGSIAFGCGGYALWFVNLVELNNQVLTPFLMIALVRLGAGYTPRRLLAVACLVTLDILGGHPEGIFVTGLFSGLFAMFMLGRARTVSALKSWVAAIALGVLGASIVLIPFIEYFPRAWNFHFSGMGFLHLWPRAMLQFLSGHMSPLASGQMWQLPDGVLDKNLWDFYRLPYDSMTAEAGFPYVGLIATGFMIGAAIKWKQLPRGGGFFILFFISAVSFSMGLFPFKLLSYIPPFHVTNNAKFYFAEIAFCACVLAGMGMDKWLRDNSSAWIFAALISVLMCGVLTINDFADLASDEILIQSIPVGLMILVIVAGLDKLRPAAAIVFLLFELAIMQPTVGPYLPLDWDKSTDAGVTLKEKGVKNSRIGWARYQVKDDFLYPANINLVHEISITASSDAMFPKAYMDWINELGGIEGEAVLRDFYPRYYPRLNDKALQSRDAAIMGLRYIISEKPLKNTGPYKLKSKDKIHIYEREDVCPSAFLWIADTRSCDSTNLKVSSGEEELSISVLWKNEPLVVNQMRYPGWRAFEDNRELSPARIGIPLLAFEASNMFGKENLLKVKFIPHSFMIGLWTSLVTAMFWMAMLIKWRRPIETA